MTAFGAAAQAPIRALRPRWLLAATLGAVGAGIMAALWLYQAVGG